MPCQNPDACQHDKLLMLELSRIVVYEEGSQRLCCRYVSVAGTSSRELRTQTPSTLSHHIQDPYLEESSLDVHIQLLIKIAGIHAHPLAVVIPVGKADACLWTARLHQCDMIQAVSVLPHSAS